MKANHLFTLFFILFSLIGHAQNAKIRGKVTDITNNESIPLANIVVLGTQIGTTSDLDGNFSLTGLTSGYIKLQISFLGYKTNTTSDIFVSNSNTPFVEIKLLTDEQILNEVVVRVDRFEKREESPIAMQSIGTKEIESNPGSNRDISRVIQSFPGVGSTPAFRNDIIIRGGGPSENRFFLDDVEIPVFNHFSTQGASGGPVGIINADFIQSVDFYSGSFPANKYNALSGMFDFKQKEGNKDKLNFQGTLGASEAALTLDGPLGKNASYIFSVRRSYLQFLFSAIGLPFLPTFNDYQFKLKTYLDTKNQITVISIGSLDHLTLNTGIRNPDASQQYILSQIPINNQWSYTFGAVYKNFFDKGTHTFVLSRNMLNNEFYKYPDNDESIEKSLDYNSSEQENKFRYELSTRSNGIKLVVGANLEYAKYFNSTMQKIYLQNVLTEFKYSTNLEIAKFGLSAQASKRFSENNLLVSIGVRIDGNNYNSNMLNAFNQISPRLALSYTITEKLVINAGTGRYFQLPAYTTLGYRNNLGELVNLDNSKYIGVNQYNIGIESRLNKSFLFSIEGFYKDYFQYPIDQYTGASLANQGADYSSVAGAVPVTYTGKGEAIGFEILNRVDYKKFNLLASYTFVRSLFTDGSGKYIPSSWDSKHLLTITGTKELKNNWRIGFKWRYVGGLPYTPYDLTTSANIQAWDAIGQPYLDYTKLNSERFAAFHQLDFRIDKNYFFSKWTLLVYIDIQNVYNFKNITKDYIIREKNDDGTYQTTSDGLNYILTFVPNESGTVLPTIGLMVKF